MKSFTQNGITFNKYREAADGQAIGIAPILVDGQEGIDPEFGGIVNAVDIGWNGARLLDGTNRITPINTFNPYAPNTVINTTGEFCLKRCS